MAIAQEGFDIFKPTYLTSGGINGGGFISGLVNSIIRVEGDSGYTNPLDIGTIWFTNPEDPIPSTGNIKLLKAKPFFPNINQYPLVNEVVYILILPSYEAQSFTTEVNFYYISPVNLWGSQFLNYFKPNLPGAQSLNSLFPNELVSLGVPNQGINDMMIGNDFLIKNTVVKKSAGLGYDLLEKTFQLSTESKEILEKKRTFTLYLKD
jgi:hypothetical protein